MLFASCTTQPHQGRRTPESATPGVLAITATSFIDTDGNRYRDTSTVVLYVFPESAQYHLPLRAKGTFEFLLETPDGQVLSRWSFSRAQVEEARRDLAPGPGFVFDLNLLANGTDRTDITEADLVAVFTPSSDDRPLRARTQSPLLIGSMSRSGAAH